MLRFYAQGAAQSIEDASVLAGCLVARPGAPAAALARYARLRRPRTAWMQRLARREEARYQTTDPVAAARRNARLALRPRDGGADGAAAPFPPDQERLYGYDAEAVLQAARPRGVATFSEGGPPVTRPLLVLAASRPGPASHTTCQQGPLGRARRRRWPPRRAPTGRADARWLISVARCSTPLALKGLVT
jgi:hypothetical protein